MYPGNFTKDPNKIALINANTGEQMTFVELEEVSCQIAHFLSRKGVKDGDVISLFSDNRMEYLVIGWAAARMGIYLTTVNRYLTADEAAYIVNDNGSSVLISSGSLPVSKTMVSHLENKNILLYSIGPEMEGFTDLMSNLHDMPKEPLAVENQGSAMLYSSGSTGQPKGIKRALTGLPMAEVGAMLTDILPLFGFCETTVYLSPAPLYHAAPFHYCMGALSLGGTVIYLEKFEPELALESIGRYRVNYSQWVPTMFVRMLKLDEGTRAKYDVSSMQLAIHAAAPCPVEIKRQMIDWWGPIIFEYYAGTEGNGMTVVTSEEWLKYPGTVGKSINAIIHVCDEAGEEVAVGETGTIYFENLETEFVYHNDEKKTQDSRHSDHSTWTTLGDVGHVNSEGYLFLTDRKAYMIISGGVNIYPQEIEDILIMHDAVEDVAVFGVPNTDFGEEVKAVVQLNQGELGDSAMTENLMSYAKAKLAGYKMPRSIDYTAELPRLPTGKLYKRILKDKYWSEANKI